MALREIWSIYEGAWSENDPGKRADILRKTLEESFVYCDPLIRTESHDQLSFYIGELQKNVPGVRIVTHSFEQHHDACLVKWTMQDGARNELANGVTCGELDGSGRLTKATVFYDLPGS